MRFTNRMDMGSTLVRKGLPPAPVFITTVLPDADEGVVYSEDILTTGATTLALTAGALPTGLAFEDNGDGAGTVAGTAAADGTFNFTITATGPGGTTTHDYTLTVIPAVYDPYAETAINLNFGYRVASVTLEDTNRLQKVANVGDAAVCVAQTSGASSRPTWTADPAGNGQPGVTFDGSDDWLKLRNSADSADSTLDAIINNDVGWLLNVVKCSAADVATDSASPESNDPVFADHGNYFMQTLRDTAGAGTYYFAHWDSGGYDPQNRSVTLGIVNVLVAKHTGGNIYANANGSESAGATSGNTGNMTQLPRWFSTSGGLFLAGIHQHGMADDVVPVNEAEIITGMGEFYS